MMSGKLNKWITIQYPATGSPAANEYGEPSISWEKFTDAWAAIEPLQGREFWAQKQVQSEVTARVRIRYVPGVTADMRAVYGSRIFSIESIIDPQEKHVELQLMCSEGVKDV